jgi:hypothetical protein
MGYLYYGTSAYAVEVEDRTLAHVKVAMLTLLRRNQGIAFSFPRSVDAGSGRETLWISPSTDLRFQFFGSRPPRINDSWVRAMINSAGARTGLTVVDEPQDETVGERIAG